VVEGGENVTAIEEAIERAKAVTDKPSFIALRTIIGYPAPTKMNTGGVHGSALGDDEVAATKKVLGFDPDKTFDVADDVIAPHRAGRRPRTRRRMPRGRWTSIVGAARTRAQETARPPARRHPARRLGRRSARPGSRFKAGGNLRGLRRGALRRRPETARTVGGSADLAGSNSATMKGVKSFSSLSISTEDWTATWYGRTLHFGIREHAMGSILSGIVLHGPTRAYGGTFLQFSDYMRPAVRLAALMDIDTIYVWTHDSIGLGEDRGPPISRSSTWPRCGRSRNSSVVRPADPNETAYAWRTILERGAASGPTGLILTRQNVPVLEGTSADGVARGGYVLGGGNPRDADVIIIATGSEVQLAVEAQKMLASKDFTASVVSMPCVEWFESQPQEYRDSVLPPEVPARVAVEAGIAQSWYKFVGDTGEIISIEHYGESADDKTLFREFGFTPEPSWRRRRAQSTTDPPSTDPGEEKHHDPEPAPGGSVRRRRVRVARRPVP